MSWACKTCRHRLVLTGNTCPSFFTTWKQKPGCSPEPPPPPPEQRLLSPPQLVYFTLTLPSSPHRICSVVKGLTSFSEDPNHVKQKTESVCVAYISMGGKKNALSVVHISWQEVAAGCLSCTFRQVPVKLSPAAGILGCFHDYSTCERMFLGALTSFALVWFWWWN